MPLSPKLNVTKHTRVTLNFLTTVNISNPPANTANFN